VRFLGSASLFQQGATPSRTTKTVATTFFLLETKFKVKFIVLNNTYRLTKKKFATHTLTPVNRPQTSKNRNYEDRIDIDIELGFQI